MSSEVWPPKSQVLSIDKQKKVWYNKDMSYDHHDDFSGGEDEDYGPDPFDYEWYGPNNDFNQSGFGGHGFDNPDDKPWDNSMSHNEDDFEYNHGHGFDEPETSLPYNPIEPTAPEYKLADWKRDDPDNYDKIMRVLSDWSIKRSKRLTKKYGECGGPEYIMEICEADLDDGWNRLMNASVNGVVRTCVYEFNDVTGQYDLSEDN